VNVVKLGEMYNKYRFIILASSIGFLVVVAVLFIYTIPGRDVIKHFKTEIEIGTDVVDGRLVGWNSNFPVSLGKVCCWLKFKNVKTASKLHIDWYYGKTNIGTDEISVKGPNEIISSYKELFKWIGPYTVEVKNKDGEVLARKGFNIVKDEVYYRSAILQFRPWILSREELRNRIVTGQSGRILRVGGNLQYKDLVDALAGAEEGDTIFLNKGVHDLSQYRNGLIVKKNNIKICGYGPKNTILKKHGNNYFTLKGISGFCLSDLAIDSGLGEIIDARNSNFVISNCKIYGYNSGAGGSNAIYTEDSIVILDRSTFDGLQNSSGQNHRGTALDMRGSNLLHAYKCIFRNNKEVLRTAFSCVFDNCIFSDNDWSVSSLDGAEIFYNHNTFSGKGMNLTNALDKVISIDDSKYLNINGNIFNF
jgi:hypothetical protein